MNSGQRYFDQGNRLTGDSCAILARDLENQSILDYLTFNPNPASCETEIKTISELSSQYPNLRFKSGYGQAPSCRIDGDSTLKYNPDSLRMPEKQQLFTRVFQAVPNFSKGSCAPNTESYLLSGWDTSVDKDCATLAERNYDRYTPFIGCVQNHMDSYAKSVSEVDVIGVSSRDKMRFEDSQRQCNIARS
jgi:hypothetical protein